MKTRAELNRLRCEHEEGSNAVLMRMRQSRLLFGWFEAAASMGKQHAEMKMGAEHWKRTVHRRALTRLQSVRSTPNKKRIVAFWSNHALGRAFTTLREMRFTPDMKEVVAFWSNRALSRAFVQFRSTFPKLPSPDAFWSSHSR